MDLAVMRENLPVVQGVPQVFSGEEQARLGKARTKG